MLYRCEIEWKDTPGVTHEYLIADNIMEDSDSIFYFVDNEEELKSLMDPDTDNEFVILKYEKNYETNTDYRKYT